MTTVKQPLPSFVQAVKRHGDGWLSDFWQVVSANTYLAMRERRTASEARSALTMQLCTENGRLFQVERPVPLYGGTRFPTPQQNTEKKRREDAYPRLVEALRDSLADMRLFIRRLDAAGDSTARRHEQTVARRETLLREL